MILKRVDADTNRGSFDLEEPDDALMKKTLYAASVMGGELRLAEVKPKSPWLVLDPAEFDLNLPDIHMGVKRGEFMPEGGWTSDKAIKGLMELDRMLDESTTLNLTVAVGRKEDILTDVQVLNAHTKRDESLVFATLDRIHQVCNRSYSIRQS